MLRTHTKRDEQGVVIVHVDRTHLGSRVFFFFLSSSSAHVARGGWKGRMKFGWGQSRRGKVPSTRSLQIYCILGVLAIKLVVLFLFFSDIQVFPVWGSESEREKLFALSEDTQLQRSMREGEEGEEEEEEEEESFVREGNVVTVRGGREKGKVLHLFQLRGHMRSGTHWVANLLNLHPHVDVKGEYNLLPLLNGIDATLKSKVNVIHKYPYFGDILKKGIGDAIARMMCEARFVKPVKRDARWLGDRSPHSLLPYIFEEFPTIFILRDGRDVVVSVIFHMLRTCKVGEACALHRWYGKSNATLAEFESKQAKYHLHKDHFIHHPQELITQDDEEWVRGIARSWARLYEDYAKVAKINPSNVMVIKYEDLHANATDGRDRMYRFLSRLRDSIDSNLAAPVTFDTRTDAGFGGKADWAGFYRKGSMSEWKTFVNGYFRKWVKEEAGGALISAGYETTHDW